MDVLCKSQKEATGDTQTAQVLELARQKGIVSRADLDKEGLPEEYLAKLAAAGHLSPLAPGVYMDAEAEVGEQLELLVVAKRIPRAIFFGVTALVFHDLTSQVFHAVEFAIERDTRTPRLDWPTNDVFHLSGASFSTGIEEHTLQGDVPIRVYSVERSRRTVARYRASGIVARTNQRCVWSIRLARSSCSSNLARARTRTSKTGSRSSSHSTI